MKNINLDQLVKPRRTPGSDQRFINSNHYGEIYRVSLFDGGITVLNPVQSPGVVGQGSINL